MKHEYIKGFTFVGNTNKTLKQLQDEGIRGFKLCDTAYDIYGNILCGFKALFISSDSNYNEVRESQLTSIRMGVKL